MCSPFTHEGLNNFLLLAVRLYKHFCFLVKLSPDGSIISSILLLFGQSPATQVSSPQFQGGPLATENQFCVCPALAYLHIIACEFSHLSSHLQLPILHPHTQTPSDIAFSSFSVAIISSSSWHSSVHFWTRSQQWRLRECSCLPFRMPRSKGWERMFHLHWECPGVKSEGDWGSVLPSVQSV